MIVPSCPKRIMIARNQLTVVMWAPCPWSHRTGKECNIVTKRIPIVFGHFVNQTVFHITPGHRNDKSYLFLPNHRCKRCNFERVDLRAAMFSIPSWQFRYTVSRSVEKARRQPACPELCAKPVGMWNRLKTGCPFLPKRRFKYNIFITKTEILIWYHTEPQRKSIRF